MTNIIEQLGGYEKAKEYLKTLESIPMHEQTEDTIMWLPHELLEYRRQHNIYEIGDKVSHTIFSSIFTINDVQSYSVLATTNTGYHTSLNIVLIRHCTDKEIAQGYRDE